MWVTRSGVDIFFFVKNSSGIFAEKKATRIFSVKILIYMPYFDQTFNDTLNNNIISFEQLGPG